MQQPGRASPALVPRSVSPVQTIAPGTGAAQPLQRQPVAPQVLSPGQITPQSLTSSHSTPQLPHQDVLMTARRQPIASGPAPGRGGNFQYLNSGRNSLRGR